ncbi:unnamed protein product [marine sediment metagenome]|uniref:Uncharacterized protein n=1 Tax=marine sediment metagenome TaxID=412755 RepID=X0U9U3_9ZZZZ
MKKKLMEFVEIEEVLTEAEYQNEMNERKENETPILRIMRFSIFVSGNE